MMNNQVPKYVTQARAAYLLGLPVEDLRRISHETGVGHGARREQRRMVFYVRRTAKDLYFCYAGKDGVALEIDLPIAPL